MTLQRRTGLGGITPLEPSSSFGVMKRSTLPTQEQPALEGVAEEEDVLAAEVSSTSTLEPGHTQVCRVTCLCTRVCV